MAKKKKIPKKAGVWGAICPCFVRPSFIVKYYFLRVSLSFLLCFLNYYYENTAAMVLYLAKAIRPYVYSSVWCFACMLYGGCLLKKGAAWCTKRAPCR